MKNSNFYNDDSIFSSRLIATIMAFIGATTNALYAQKGWTYVETDSTCDGTPTNPCGPVSELSKTINNVIVHLLLYRPL